MRKLKPEVPDQFACPGIMEKFSLMNKKDTIYVAGHDGMVGSAIVRNLREKGYSNILTTNYPELDLIRQSDVEQYFEREKPDYVIDAAAKVGGIVANDNYRGQFIYENLMIQNNLIHCAHLQGVKKLLFLGSSCIYPKMSPQPMKEEYLLTNVLESTNEPYAIAKISGIKMCESYYRQYGDDFISVMPTNLYGFNDNFNLQNSHVIPALIRKVHEAKLNGDKSIIVWGTGTPKREFLHVDDMADACVFVMEKIDGNKLYDQDEITHINIGSGTDISISELAALIVKIVGYQGKITYDTEKPDGTPRKLLDVSRLNSMGWRHKISLEEGLRKTYSWYLKSESIRK
jgi:GDP-L-fucose synthase